MRLSYHLIASELSAQPLTLSPPLAIVLNQCSGTKQEAFQPDPYSGYRFM